MRWIWIDKFIEFNSGTSAKAVKNVSLAEEHLHDHFPGFTVMPNTLILEGLAQTGGLLVLSNVFMTFAWYGHLKNLSNKAWYVAALISWGIALFEYLLQVPANRIGATEYNLGQLKIMQEVITLSVFVPFAVFYMDQPFKLDYLWAALCMMGAVYFIFRS